MKIITVGGWDCCYYTESVWFNANMKKSDKVELGDFANDENSDNLVKALKKAGFKEAKNQAIDYGGNF